MDASRLSSIVQTLIEAAQRHRISKLLSTFQSHLTNLAGNPANPPFQTESANSLDQLAEAVRALRNELEPSQIKNVEEIGAAEYFIDDFPSMFRSWLNENSATPTVAKEKVDKFAAEFKAYLDTLTQLYQRLAAIGISPLDLKDGDPELGILIPRIMFDNHLDEMIRELRNVNRILRAFSELETGAAHPVEVRSISTTDPLYAFGLPVAVVVSVGRVVSWALGVWKQVEEIREIRARTLKVSSFTEAEIEDFFGNKIKQQVEAAVEEKIKELFSERPRAVARDHELKQEIKFGLEYILAGIERGLVIEIRHLPPPIEPATDQTAEESPVSPQAVAVLAKQLSFPAVDPTITVLSLPSTAERPFPKPK